jgi:hemoglobin-like flavoprotein/uncharacterized membrane protein YgcG
MATEVNAEAGEIINEEIVDQAYQEEAVEGEEEEAVEGEEAEAEAEDGSAAAQETTEEETKVTSGGDINVDSFDELHVEESGIQAANDIWRMFINTSESGEAAGEVIYSALFDAAPSLQSLFVTPRAVQAMKFMNGIGSFVTSLDDPPKLKILVETLGFGHLHLDVTVPRVVIFRNAILDIFAAELGQKFSSAARDAWTKLLNYVGGAIIYVKTNYAGRINTLLSSWKIATDGKADEKAIADALMDGAENEKAKAEIAEMSQKKGKANDGQETNKNTEGNAGGGSTSANQVPTTYNEMFKFNSAVMGFGNNLWMGEVLECFHNIVTNVANSVRLQEECDVLVLRISKVEQGSVNFAEYKSCMLASLRSLLPKDWSTQHEVSWCWLWENVERIMQKNMGSPPKWEKALAKVIGGLDENTAFELRKETYARFFAAAPAGQDFFKQSNTYLHFIADRVLQMTLEMYMDPVKMVDDISALGLRHVGYAIPTEFMGPFVTACVEVMSTATTDTNAVEAYRWSLGLIGKIMVRTITEGSTICMKAINTNNAKQLKKAIGCAPRGERATWLLLVQVGTQNISPLYWSIESGALEAAQTIIEDLLAFRADRDRYYFGMDNLFARHPEIVQKLATQAPSLLPKLLDLLIWRSRTTEHGTRRANYYLRHLLMDANGKFSPTLSWIVRTRDPRLVCHPIIVMLSDTVWGRLACRAFIFRKSWFLFTLLVFIAGQSILKHLNDGENTELERILIFFFRAIIYVCSMTQLLYAHFTKILKAIKTGKVTRIAGCLRVPDYLGNWQEGAGFSLMLMLIMMLILEPIVWCLSDNNDKLFFEECHEASRLEFPYTMFSMFAMFLYFVLLIDLAVISTKVSAYVLVCIRMLSEVGLFILAVTAILLTFSSAISVVKHSQRDFEGIQKGLLTLLEMTLKMYDGKHFEEYESDPVVLTCVFTFLVAVGSFLTNMLVAQLTCAYEAVYVDMVGFARLERIEIIVNTMPSVSEKRWCCFRDSLKLNANTEFNAGDVGVPGGIQILEPSNLNPTAEDIIKRFGGPTNVDTPWPADEQGDGDEDDRFDRMEQLIQKTMKRWAKGSAGKGGKGSGMGSSGGNGSSNGNQSGGSEGSEMASEEGGEA